MSTMANTDDEYFLPLEDQRVFGAGIKRKRIDFIPATTEAPTLVNSPSQNPSNISVAERYLSIVRPSPAAPSPSATADINTLEATSTSEATSIQGKPPTNLCPICNHPLSPTHESTISHQLCLIHSHPPSHLDRSRHGLRYLASYGWDPDARQGLGAHADGILYPIKPLPKHDTVGLKERVDVEALAGRGKVGKGVEGGMEKRKAGRVMLNAKQVRKQEAEGRRKAERLRGLFYGSGEVERYLGSG